MTVTRCPKCLKKNDAIKLFFRLIFVKLVCLLIRTNSPFFKISRHYHRDREVCVKDKAEKKYSDLRLVLESKALDHPPLM